VISASEMQTYDIALRNAKQEQDAAQEALQVVRDGISKSSSAGNTVVRSTIDGMVLDVPVKEGNSVIERNNFNEGTTIATIADMNDLIFQGKVDESEVGKVRWACPWCSPWAPSEAPSGMPMNWSTSRRRAWRRTAPSSSRSAPR
jgi:HlyD family secretion protein